MRRSTARSKTGRKPRSAVRRRVIWFVCLSLGFYLGICGALAWTTVMPRSMRLDVTPTRYHLAFEQVRFASADGTSLAGWYIPAGTAHPPAVIILCHGVDSNRMGMLDAARVLHSAGYDTLLFDFRARGESQGARCTLGLRETDDLLAAINFVRKQRRSTRLPIGVLGDSMGGAVALMGSARAPEVRAVVAESPFASLDHAVSNHFNDKLGVFGPLFSVPTRFLGERLIGASCADISPVREIAQISPRPLLLIQDADDRLCPPQETAALMRAAGFPKSLWTVPHASHIQALNTDPNGYRAHVIGFFDAAFRAAHAARHPASN